MKTILSALLVVTAMNLHAQADTSYINLQFEPNYFRGPDHSAVFQMEKEGMVYYESIGETYHDILPFTGWSTVESGLTSDRPWDRRHPYDNHMYLVHSEGRYAPQRKQEPFKLYRIENGKKFTGMYTDSITNDSGVKELSFIGYIAEGLLNGPVTFYFTSRDKYKGSGFKVGDIKSNGFFEDGEMVGEWRYYGSFGLAQYAVQKLLEIRHYELGKVFPIKGEHYSYYSDVHYVGSRYEYEKDWVMKYVHQYNLFGNITRKEELLSYKQVGGSSDIEAIYEITAYVSDTAYTNVIHTKGQKMLKPRHSQKIGYWEYFYKNGSPYSHGNYVDDKESGLWTYYYEDGKIKSVREYAKDDSKLLQWWDKNGVQTVKDGEGKIKHGSTFRLVKDGKVVPE